MKRTGIAGIVGLILVAGAVFAPPAAADDGGITPDPQIAEMLAAVPGGIAVSEYRAVWPELDMEMTVPQPASRSASSTSSLAVTAAAVGTCATGRVCAYSLNGMAGSQLSWSSCNTSFPVGSFEVRSIANARSTGYMQARSRTATLATANAGQWKNVYGATYRISCYT